MFVIDILIFLYVYIIRFQFIFFYNVVLFDQVIIVLVQVKFFIFSIFVLRVIIVFRELQSVFSFFALVDFIIRSRILLVILFVFYVYLLSIVLRGFQIQVQIVLEDFIVQGDSFQGFNIFVLLEFMDQILDLIVCYFNLNLFLLFYCYIFFEEKFDL